MNRRKTLGSGVRSRFAVVLAGMAVLLTPVICLGQASSFNISSVAGDGTQGFRGDGATATSAQLNSPVAVAVDSSGNIYIADAANNRVRKVSGGKISTYAGNGTPVYAGDGGAAGSASLADPYGLVLDRSGNLYISDLNNQVIRQVSPGGTITTFAGTNAGPPQFNGDGGPATSAYFNLPIGLAIDTAGNIYVADSSNACIRMITPAGIISTVAGTPTVAGYSGDGGPARQAKLGKPFGVAVDSAGNLYISDPTNNVVRLVTPDGKISTAAGNGKAGFSGDGGPASSAQLSKPEGIAVDAAGALYIADYGNNRIRQVVNGVINTIAGTSFSGYTGDGGAATNARLFEPAGVSVDSAGNVYVSDYGNDVIRMLTPTGPAVAGAISAGAYGAFSAAAPGSWIEIYGSNLALNKRSWGTADFSGSNAPTSLDGTSVTVGGQAAFVDYISGGQVNVQLPSNVSTGTQQIVVKNAAGTSASSSITVNGTQPGLLAQYKANGVQYATAVFPDGKTFAMPPNAVAGIPSQRAKPGDTLTLYGVGFGPVTPAVAAGQIAPPNTCTLCLNSPLQISIGGVLAVMSYAGLSPGSVGLYQFNVVVPAVPPGDSLPVTFTLGGAKGTQTLAIAVQ